MKTLIFSGGDFSPSDSFNYEKYDLIICADKGFENLEKAGVKPHIALGDFDSTDIPDIPFVKYPAEKDVTDTEIAIDYAIGNGADEIMILGGTGGRLDHTFANILLLYRTYKKGTDVKMYDGKNLCFITDKSIKVQSGGKKYLSLFPLFCDVSNLSLKGTKYELENYNLQKDSSLCVSNEFKENEAEIAFQSGVLLVILSNDK